uniref:Uncharacterized protein n=1 Tax=Rhizophora mucronata TaxID=61149 RepID=A0A2P2IIB7_RHIMU
MHMFLNRSLKVNFEWLML